MIYIGSDHAGFSLKTQVLSHFPEFVDLGTNSAASCDYPIYAHSLCLSVAQDDSNLGILICGSGTGMCISANKHPKIRAANCWNTEIARLAREHNNANVLTLASRFLTDQDAFAIINVFINTKFSNEERHIKRVEMLHNMY